MTVREIAKMANVSPTTVSIVLNKKGGVGDETRKKVLEIANEYGYQVKQKEQTKEARKNIRFIKYKQLGLLTEKNGDFITKIIDGIEKEASEKGFELRITNVTNSNMKEIISFINEENSDDGIIFLGTEFMMEYADVLKTFHVPVIVIDNEMRYFNIDSVNMCNTDIVYTAIKHMFDLGHRKIGHIKSCWETPNLKNRQLHYALTMQTLGLENNSDFTYSALPELESAYETIKKELLSRKAELPTAFFADNDALAIGTMRALKDIGIKVPEDISIVGIDDLEISSICEPRLTTVRVRKMAMGQAAVRRLLEIISGKTEGVNKIYVSGELIVRESTSFCKQ